MQADELAAFFGLLVTVPALIIGCLATSAWCISTTFTLTSHPNNSQYIRFFIPRVFNFSVHGEAAKRAMGLFFFLTPLIYGWIIDFEKPISFDQADIIPIMVFSAFSTVIVSGTIFFLNILLLQIKSGWQSYQLQKEEVKASDRRLEVLLEDGVNSPEVQEILNQEEKN